MTSPTLPVHVVVIMDGTAHWARYRGLDPSPGVVPVRAPLQAVVDTAIQQRVSWLTLLPPPDPEPVGGPNMARMLLEPVLDGEVERLHARGVRIRTPGTTAGLPEQTAARLDQARDLTAGNTTLQLVLAAGHDGRAELLDAVRAVVTAHTDGGGTADTVADAITTESLDRRLHGDGGLPEADLVIGTGGRHRLSHALPWHCGDAELIFLDVLWPDFTAEHFRRALELYHLRRRRRDELSPHAGSRTAASAADADAGPHRPGSSQPAPIEAGLHDGGVLRAAAAGVREGMDKYRLVPSFAGVGELVTLPVAVTAHLGGNLAGNLYDTARFTKARLARALLGPSSDQASGQIPSRGPAADSTTDAGGGPASPAAPEAVADAGKPPGQAGL
jgi:undecaprenyl diphosphate synthase